MPLIPTRDLLADAAARRTGLGALNVVHLETCEGIVAGAERAGLPVVLQISENCAKFHGGLTPLACAVLAVAENSSARVAVHLDHAEDAALARHAVDAGFGSVMFDGAALPYDDNVAATADAARYAHAHGTIIEAELGKVGGKDGAHAPGVRTDPGEARRFAAATGVDALAVAVGSSHAMVTRTASLDFELIARLHAAVDVPLVLHGSSGVADSDIRTAIAAGITKINVSTQLNKMFTSAVRDYLDNDPDVVDSRKYVRAGRDAVAAETARLLAVFDVGAGA
ncbi:class II fructose-bisphosphate aldolase [Spelaeicoccus albus]|uniref:Fructose-bisphosphate aldolase class II n=1 Tax=Spelaeicoccus albus TaxID=1280376 RepID=A0A7Z0A9T7_9MICO|nr:class II fructose-bisphosphate aldolase [Spelaeicoccus albus]NYI65728.1 fructose-bisphosphate aldolase class II [Spelaeicoccus albus]